MRVSRGNLGSPGNRRIRKNTITETAKSCGIVKSSRFVAKRRKRLCIEAVNLSLGE